MPNGKVITRELGDCPRDAIQVQRANGEILRSKPTPSQPRPTPPTAAPAPQPRAPAANTHQPTDYDRAHLICRAFKQAGASECKVDSNIFSTSTVEATLHLSPPMALVTCRDVAAAARKPPNVFAGKDWEIRIYSPFSGNRPTASCPL